MEQHVRQRWIDRHYTTFVVLFACVLGVLALLPHLIAYQSTPAGTSYLLNAYPYTPDANTYFTWITQASSGDVLFNLKYTPELTPHVIFHPVFLAMGLLVRGGIPLPLVWLGTQFASIVLLVAVISRFIEPFVRSFARRAYALVLSCTAGGFGFLYYWTDRIPEPMSRPADIMMAETTIGRSLMWPFIFCFAIALMLLSLMALQRMIHTRQLRYALMAGAWGALLILIHPYDAVSLVIIGTLYFIVEMRSWAWRNLAVFYLCLAVPVTYYLYILQNKYFAETSAVPMQSPEVLSYVLGFGTFVPLALIGSMVLLKRRWLLSSSNWRLAAIWLFITPILVYIPIGFQRRLIQGWVLPLVLFSMITLSYAWDRIRRKVRSRVILVLPVLFALFAAGSYLTLVRNDVIRVRSFGSPLYLSDDLRDAMQWLSAHSRRSDVVLSSAELGNIIPRLSGNTVYIGHWAQTYRYSENAIAVDRFFGGGMTVLEREQFLRSNAIQYVVVSPYEWSLGGASIADRDHSLQRVFSNGTVTIYRTTEIGST